MTNLINVATASLPRSLDVNVTVNKPQTEQTTDLSTSVFVQSSGGFDFGAGRIAYYADYAGVAADSRVSAQGLLAARDFFAQSPRAKFLAIAQAFSTAQSGYVNTGKTGAASAFAAVANGSFAVSIDGVSRNITAISFTGLTTLAQVAAAIQTALRTGGSGGFTSAVVTALSNGTFRITSGTAGGTSQVSVLAAVSPTSGTDISGPGFLNGRLGTAYTQIGYTPTGSLPDELTLIQQAATASGRFVYGWALDASYRDSQSQIDAAAWALAQRAVMPVVSNNPLAWDPSSTTDIGPVVQATGNFRTWPIYHDNAAYYPDTALLAIMLSVDYDAKNSTITAKFKDLAGIPLVGVTVSQWLTLQSKGYNTFTLTGNTARVYREGTTGSESWFADDVTNLDNFAEDLQVNVFNCFLRNGKIPYTTQGQALLQDAIAQVCEQYVFNGTFADRQVTDLTQAAGFRTDPAYAIVPTPINLMSDADRAARIGPPFVVNCNLAGAIHTIAINVNAYS